MDCVFYPSVYTQGLIPGMLQSMGSPGVGHNWATEHDKFLVLNKYLLNKWWMDDLSCVSRIPSPIWLVFFLQHIDIPRPFSSQKSKFSFDPLAIILSLASQDQLSERVIQTCYLHSFTTQLYPSTKSTLVKVTSYLLVAKKMIVFHHCLIYPLPHLTSWTCLLSWISFFPGKTLPP